VSIVSASIALSGRMGNSHLSTASIARIRAAAERLGYQQNYLATALKEGRSWTIGLSAGSVGYSIVGNSFWGLIGSGIELTARNRGYDVLLLGGTMTSEPVKRGLQFLSSHRIDGLIVPPNLYFHLPPDLETCTLPVVMLMGSKKTSKPRVIFVDEPGVTQAVAHLVQLGHRHLVWVGKIGPNHELHTVRERVFQQACRREKVHASRVIIPDGANEIPNVNSVEELLAAARVLKIPPQATAMVCMNDALALAMLYLLQERGLRCPHDLSLVGFDDVYVNISPQPLTTISHELEALGAAAANLLINTIEDPRPDQRAVIEKVPSRLVLGSTTGPPRS